MIRPPYGHCPYNTPKPPMGCCLFKSGFRFTPYLAVGFACRKCGSFFSHFPYIRAGIPRISAHYAEAIMDAICSSQIFGHSYSLTQSPVRILSAHHAETTDGVLPVQVRLSTSPYLPFCGRTPQRARRSEVWP